MSTFQCTAVEPDNRIQLPADWVESLGPNRLVTLDRTSEGIIIRPCPRFTWDDIFATRLTVGSATPGQQEDEVEVTGDDFLF